MDRGNDHESEKPDDDRAHGSVGISPQDNLVEVCGQLVRHHHHGVNHRERSIRRASSVVPPVRRLAQFVRISMHRGATVSRTAEEARPW
jgi:hypothetical protein